MFIFSPKDSLKNIFFYQHNTNEKPSKLLFVQIITAGYSKMLCFGLFGMMVMAIYIFQFKYSIHWIFLWKMLHINYFCNYLLYQYLKHQVRNTKEMDIIALSIAFYKYGGQNIASLRNRFLNKFLMLRPISCNGLCTISENKSVGRK